MAPSALFFSRSPTPDESSRNSSTNKLSNESANERISLISKPKFPIVGRLQQFLGFKHRAALWTTVGLSMPWFFMMCLNIFTDLNIEAATDKYAKELGVLGELWLFRPEENFKRKVYQGHVVVFCSVGTLAILQFIPAFRQYSWSLHRFLGRFIFIGVLLASIAGWIVTPDTFGGSFDENMSLYCFGVMILVPCGIAWRRIRQGKIQEHKEWVIRGMMAMGGALSIRIILKMLSLLVMKLGRWDGIWTCQQFLAAIEDDAWVFSKYPICKTDIMAKILVPCAVGEDVNDNRAALATAFRLAFGTSVWMAVVIHVYLGEYLAHRSRKNSQQLSLKA